MEKTPTDKFDKDHDADRREFLRRSIYAAYATPLITALLVEDAAAGNSNNNGRCSRKWCERHWASCCDKY
jgi:hypothetical protein